MDNQIANLKEVIEKLSEDAEFDYQKSDTYQPQVTALIKQIDQFLQDDDNLNKKQRVELHYLKGKVSDILPEYTKQAEECLTKAMKLNPYHSDSLITLGHILWKKRDYLAAKQCFETVIDKDPNNIKALQYLSIVLRQVGDAKERPQNVGKSVEIAKKALMLDLKNDYSWYLIGNAYMSNYFSNLKLDNKELQMAIQAYTQSEKNSVNKRVNPDLYFNRGNIYNYYEDYQLAYQDYQKAGEIDKTLTLDNIKELEKKVLTISDLIQNKCRISPKKLQNIVKQIPLGFKKQPQGYQLCTLSQLQIGINKQLILTCKSLVNITNAQTVPAGFIIVDVNQHFASLSVYHITQEIYDKIRENTDIFIIEPVVKEIKLDINNQVQMIKSIFQQIKYNCIQITDANKFYVENEKITQQLAPSMVVNQTFEK